MSKLFIMKPALEERQTVCERAVAARLCGTGTPACAKASFLKDASTGKSAGATRAWSFPIFDLPRQVHLRMPSR